MSTEDIKDFIKGVLIFLVIIFLIIIFSLGFITFGKLVNNECYFMNDWLICDKGK